MWRSCRSRLLRISNFNFVKHQFIVTILLILGSFKERCKIRRICEESVHQTRRKTRYFSKLPYLLRFLCIHGKETIKRTMLEFSFLYVSSLITDAVKRILSGQGYNNLTVNLFGTFQSLYMHFRYFTVADSSGAMAENGRMNKAGDVLQAFSTIMQAHRGIVSCAVTSAKVCTCNAAINYLSSFKPVKASVQFTLHIGKYFPVYLS